MEFWVQLRSLLYGYVLGGIKSGLLCSHSEKNERQTETLNFDAKWKRDIPSIKKYYIPETLLYVLTRNSPNEMLPFCPFIRTRFYAIVLTQYFKDSKL